MRPTDRLAWRTANRCQAHCLRRAIQQPARRCFASTGRSRNEFPNHYETLHIEPSASDKEIKKQFYALSKQYHPDLHPNDSNASQRFVKISEAYAVLSSTEKRTIYDRDYARAFRAPSATGPSYPSGSFSSAATPAGGRPASGLSRRRTRFQGPPPSFYKNGGWGEQASKRAEHASRPSHTYETQQGEGSVGAGQNDTPGTGPGGFTHGFENDVPHFDSTGHFQTHSTIERTRHRARRRMEQEFADVEAGGNGAFFGFVIVSGILATALLLSGVFTSKTSSKTAPSEEKA